MLNALNVIKGAVSSKDLVPVLTHIAVHEGRIHGFDGRIHISAPVPVLKRFSFTVPMLPFVAAVEVCEGEPQLTLVGENVLTIRDKKGFLATMPVGPMEAFPMSDNAGKKTKVQGILPVLQALHPFIGIDGSRPWAASVLFQGAIALATNNVILVEVPVPSLLPKFALPIHAVEEILRIGMEPKTLTISDTAAIFHYPGDIWLRTALLEDNWPDAKAILKAAHQDAHYQAVPEGLLTAVQQIRSFCPDARHPVIRCEGDRVSTLDGVTSASVGGLKGEGVGTGAYHVEPLALALSVAQTVDWTRFPRVPFAGHSHDLPLDGVLLGITL